MIEHTKRRNLNRGYMKLEVWHESIALYKITWQIAIDAKVDFKIRSQVADAAQSVPSNVAEGYSRRSIKEYIQHLYVAAGSLSELFSRMIALKEGKQISEEGFEALDALHYQVENKLLNLIKSLEHKRDSGSCIDRVTEGTIEYGR